METKGEYIKDVILSLTQKQLKSAIISLSADDRKGFIGYSGLNNKQLYSWLRNNKNNLTYANLARNYLLYLDVPGEFIDSLLIHNEADIANYLMDKALLDLLSCIVFIDGDNVSTSIKSIIPYAPADPLMEWKIHVIIIFRNGTTSTDIIGLEHRPWLSILNSSTKDKDAVDQALSVAMTSLNVFLINWVDIPFYIVTNDHFAFEIAQDIPRWTYRNIEIIDGRNVNVGSYITARNSYVSHDPIEFIDTSQFNTNTLLFNNLSQFSNNSPQFDSNTSQFSNNSPQFNNNLSKFSNNSPQFDSNTSQFSNNSPQFNSNINSNALQLNYNTSQINNNTLPSNNIPQFNNIAIDTQIINKQYNRNNSIPDFITKIGDVKLIELYKIYRQKSDREFASEYNINFGSFISFKRGRGRSDHEKEREAVRLYLSNFIREHDVI